MFSATTIKMLSVLLITISLTFISAANGPEFGQQVQHPNINREYINGPVTFDSTVLSRLIKEAYGGITRFYINVVYILLQYLREASTNGTAESIDAAKLTAEQILRGGVDYRSELSRMSKLLGDIQRRQAPKDFVANYSTTEGIPPGEEIVRQVSLTKPIRGLVGNIWSRVSGWSRRVVGLNQTQSIQSTEPCCEPQMIDSL